MSLLSQSCKYANKKSLLTQQCYPKIQNFYNLLKKYLDVKVKTPI